MAGPNLLPLQRQEDKIFVNRSGLRLTDVALKSCVYSSEHEPIGEGLYAADSSGVNHLLTARS